MPLWPPAWWEQTCFEPVADFLESDKFRSIRSEILRDLTPTDRILEVGMGSGLNVPHYPAGVTSIATVTMDAAPSRHAAAKAARRGMTLDHTQGDGQSLPFPDGTFDVVVSTLILCTVADPPGFLKEVARVLRPGGTFASFEHCYVPAAEGGSSLGRALAHLTNPLNGFLACGCDNTRPFPGQAMREAGLEAVWRKDVAFPMGKLVYGVMRAV
ncbi:unnamed protein product [Ostreobium quekettii]|uniref:Methyltransferase type 11 domain-containing protein n=1 Tax=Ostreobium quekettii TaxID=121088 RepID=A0A8S1JI27_9CHLO|nr:unnamed protein product [Ostreobium quekettii]|eukprot:evm.model.scf_983.3 EVM.evm.TU.scf_983.3   scf_983:31150-31788(+)